MKKDFYTLAICTLLFLAGVIWANLVPSSNFWEIKIDGAFSVLSAIATATAAIAAWQAARFTAMQSATTARQARWQEYRFHYEEFRELLGNTEKVLNVEFHNPQAIYNRIFPKNRDIHAPFSLEGGRKYSLGARLSGNCSSSPCNRKHYRSAIWSSGFLPLHV